MTKDKNAEKSAKEVAREIVCTYWFENQINDRAVDAITLGELACLNDAVATAINHERTKRLSWPSEVMLEDWAFKISKKYKDFHNIETTLPGQAIRETYNWLKSVVKPITVPEFTDDYLEMCWLSEDEIMLHPSDCYRAGFKRAMKLIKGECGT